jgi:hypothetical protein
MVLSQSAIDMAPPFNTVSRYFFFGLFALILSITTLFLGDASLSLLDFRFAGVLHVYLLGFVMSVILGALYQLIPVVLEAPFYTLKGSFWLFVLFVFGALGLSFGMLFGQMPLMHGGGALVYAALAWFGFLFMASFLHVKKWSIVTAFLFCASVWLLVGISLGFVALLGFSGVDFGIDLANLVARHAFISLGGFVFFVVMGVSLVLLPMFSLSHGVSTIYMKFAFVFMNFGLLLALLGALHVTVGLVVVGLVFYIYQYALILKNRMRKKREYWFYHVSFALFSLSLALVFGFLGAMSMDENLIKIALWFVLVGFGFHFIVGHLYKILPFLIWYEFISPLVGKQKVPMLHEMIDEKGAYIQLILSSFGVLIYGIGLVLHVKSILILGVVCLLVAALFLLKVLYGTYKFKNTGVTK